MPYYTFKITQQHVMQEHLQNVNIPLSTSSIYIDVGLSHNPPQSTRWLTDNPNVYVFGFEPNTEAIAVINERRKHNPVLSRLHIIPVALGDPKEPTQVQVYSLSHFFLHFPWSRFPIINYLKIDAQGSNLAILCGASNYLRERVVYITVENTEDAIEAYMNSQNFTCVKHPMTEGSTFLNNDYAHLRDIYIYQNS